MCCLITSQIIWYAGLTDIHRPRQIWCLPAHYRFYSSWNPFPTLKTRFSINASYTYRHNIYRDLHLTQFHDKNEDNWIMQWVQVSPCFNFLLCMSWWVWYLKTGIGGIIVLNWSLGNWLSWISWTAAAPGHCCIFTGVSSSTVLPSTSATGCNLFQFWANRLPTTWAYTVDEDGTTMQSF
jgi:hypothetical protein